jgi:hypothetical protein
MREMIIYAFTRVQYAYIIMRNMKVMMIIKSIYWSAWQQLKDKLQANTEERKHINIKKWTNKNEEKYTNNVITKNYMTQILKYY